MSFFKDINKKLYELPLMASTINWTKKNSFPGFFKVPIYDVLRFIVHELRQEDIITRANSIAYSLFLSLFPTMLVFVTLIPIILPFFADYILPLISEELIQYTATGQVDFKQTIIAQFNDFLRQIELLPTNMHSQIITFFSSVLLEPRFGMLSVGFVLAIIFASNGMVSLMNGFEKSHPTTFKKRNFFIKRLIGIRLTFIMGFLVTTAILFIILGNFFISWAFGIIHADNFIVFALTVLRYIVIFSMFYFGIAIVYRLGAPTLKRFSYFSPGTMLATILSLLSSWVFSLYINNYGQYNELYGSIGTIIVLMIWIQINAFILLIGFELNAAIAVNRDLRRALAKAEGRGREEEEE